MAPWYRIQELKVWPQVLFLYLTKVCAAFFFNCTTVYYLHFSSLWGCRWEYYRLAPAAPRDQHSAPCGIRQTLWSLMAASLTFLSSPMPWTKLLSTWSIGLYLSQNHDRSPTDSQGAAGRYTQKSLPQAPLQGQKNILPFIRMSFSSIEDLIILGQHDCLSLL